MSAVFQHVTVPTDGSSTAAAGVKFALELVAGGGALTFCGVVDPTLVGLPAEQGIAIDPGPMLAMLGDNATAFCREAQALAAALGVDSDIMVLHGRCVESIGVLTRENGTDAIVIGSHARSGLARTVLGSVAEGLLRHGDVPVVVAHEDDILRTGPVAVAVDESPASEAAVGLAMDIACARSMSLALIHVSKQATGRVGDTTTPPALARAAERAQARKLIVTLALREGQPAEKLLQTAEELECSILVMGTHGRSLLAQMVLGSVAAQAVERAHLPVITVRRSNASAPRALADSVGAPR